MFANPVLTIQVEILVQKWIDLDHKILNPFNKPTVLVVSGVDLNE